MPKSTFNLCRKETGENLITFDTLKECVMYCKSKIINHKDYFVDEMEGTDIIDTCCLFYLIDNYPNIQKIPASLHDC